MDFIAEFNRKMEEYQPKFEILGLLSADDRIYQIGTDTKVLSTAFELMARPLIFKVAEEHGLVVHEPAAQNFYPDFTLMTDRDDPAKIAVDVKSTYRNFGRGGKWNASFTLGSYTSFLINETKNIAFPYSQYAKHYILGFIYTRTIAAPVADDAEEPERIFTLDKRGEIPCPIEDVACFVQEKYRIASKRAGSGNTTNIGSITGTSIAAFAEGNGPFAADSDEAFLTYWRSYGVNKDRAPRTPR